jgi:hypothetical protein
MGIIAYFYIGKVLIINLKIQLIIAKDSLKPIFMNQYEVSHKYSN